MTMIRLTHCLVGTYAMASTSMNCTNRRPDERGISQSAENAILISGAVAVALLIISVVKGFLEAKLSTLQ